MNYNDVKLIELVKHCPTVYDSKIAEFKIPHRKEEAWEIISKEMEITGEATFTIRMYVNSKSLESTKSVPCSSGVSKPLADDTGKICP